MYNPILILVVLQMRGLSTSEKLAFANQILRKMVGNLNFTALAPIVVLLQTAVDNLALAIRNWQKGNPLLTAELHLAVAEVVRILKYLAAGVEFYSHNNAVIALSSGFAIRQATHHPATGFTAKRGPLSGSAKLRTDAVRGAAYLWQESADPITDSSWAGDKITNHANYSYESLPLGKHWFRIALIVDDEQQEFSDPISLDVL